MAKYEASPPSPPATPTHHSSTSAPPTTTPPSTNSSSSISHNHPAAHNTDQTRNHLSSSNPSISATPSDSTSSALNAPENMAAALSESGSADARRPANIKTDATPRPSADTNIAPATTAASPVETPTGDKAPLTEGQKKANHIASEKKRRTNIREQYDKLAEMTPGMEGQGRSEGRVLEEVVRFGQQLLQERVQLIHDIEARGGVVDAALRPP